METHEPTLKQKLDAMRKRIAERQQRKDAANHADLARVLTRHDVDVEEKFRQARSMIRHGDFSSDGYLVANGLIPR